MLTRRAGMNLEVALVGAALVATKTVTNLTLKTDKRHLSFNGQPIIDNRALSRRLWLWMHASMTITP